MLNIYCKQESVILRILKIRYNRDHMHVFFLCIKILYYIYIKFKISFVVMAFGSILIN